MAASLNSWSGRIEGGRRHPPGRPTRLEAAGPEMVFAGDYLQLGAAGPLEGSPRWPDTSGLYDN
jgi:hypothetical protein